MNVSFFQLQIGQLTTLKREALIPYPIQSISILHYKKNKDLATELAEGIVLQLLQKHPSGQAKVILNEAEPSHYFSTLKKLYAKTDKQFGKQLFTAKDCIKLLQELNELAHRRYALLASTDQADIFHYNNTATIPEPIYYLLLTGISHLATESQSLQNLKNLCLQGAKAGIIPVLLNNIDYLENLESQQHQFKTQVAFWQKINAQSYDLDLSTTLLTGKNQPQEVWRLLHQFKLQAGISADLRQQWLNQLLENHQQVQAQNPDEDFIRIPIGIEGVQPAYFCLGEATNAYHAMIGGAVRSGKSTLLNNLILSICETYAPDELRLWLFDYREGVEFSIFKEVAHLDALHIDSDNPQYALDAFIAFEKLMSERAKLFRDCQPPVSRLVDYNQQTDKPLPRCLLIIDEAQVLFENRDYKKAAQQLLKSVARRGAAFGLHILLSTQSYQNVDLDRDVKAQFRLRIGLQLSSSMECRALMGRDNDAMMNLPRYHAVYNGNFGEMKNNRVIALSALTRDDLWQRLQALKQRYPKKESRFDFQTMPNKETAKPKSNDDFSDWDDLI